MPFADAGDLSWNLLSDARGLFAFHFMVNAFRAGTIIAVLAGAIGWFMVMRRESFVGFCVAGALLIAAVPRGNNARGFSEESAVVGTVQALALASGFLFVSLYHGFLTGVNSLLFGSFLGVTDTQVLVLALFALAALLLLTAIGRPLLFASIDTSVAAIAG